MSPSAGARRVAEGCCEQGDPLLATPRWPRGLAPEARTPRVGRGRGQDSLILQGGVTSRHSLCAPTPHLVHRYPW